MALTQSNNEVPHPPPFDAHGKFMKNQIEFVVEPEEHTTLDIRITKNKLLSERYPDTLRPFGDLNFKLKEQTSEWPEMARCPT